MKFFIFLLLSASTLQAQQLKGYSTENSKTQLQLEKDFRESINKTRFKTHLKALTKNPHVAGTPANRLVRDYITNQMQDAGLNVDIYPYEVYMSTSPGESSIEIVSPESLQLNQKEEPLEEDPFSQHKDLMKAWNAYSGTGDVTSHVVYANYGTKADFEMLKALNIDVKGKIVVARYGGNFRGYKAKYAEANGAAGLIIYTDPKDSGFTKGLVFPEGVYYNESAIQRGSVLTTDWTGDPLTPYEPALDRSEKKSPQRLSPSEAGLHTIPVTPISYGAANLIFKHMKGQVVPQAWQGGLPYTYRLEGGMDLKLRLKVNQPRGFTKIENIVGTIKGKNYPDEWIILGCHYDAWAFGATDPNSGTAMLISLAETLGQMAKNGQRPARSIMIAHWDAEEHGVIGSSEWVEELKSELQANAVAYINLDGAASGKQFSAASSPSLKTILSESTKHVDYPYTEQSVYEHWARGEQNPSISNLGGGSDHIAFYMHVGIPSLSAGYRGPTLYHTNYDDYYFYENFVDPDFQIGPNLEAIMGTLTLRLANATIIPYDVLKYADDLNVHFKHANEKVLSYHPDFEGFTKSKKAIFELEQTAIAVNNYLIQFLKQSKLKKSDVKTINAHLLGLEKSFLIPEGLEFGDWYKSLYVSSDPFSGYASWILPAIEYEIQEKDKADLSLWDNKYAKVINDLNQGLMKILQMSY